MSKRRTYHAYTGIGKALPDYISVNQETTGQVSVCVRGNGQTSTIYLTPEQAEHLATDIIAGINSEEGR